MSMELILSGVIFFVISAALVVGIIANIIKYPPTSEKLYSLMMILLGFGGLGIVGMIIVTYLKTV